MRYLATLFILFLILMPFRSMAAFVGNSSSVNLTNGLAGWWTFDGKDTNWAAGTTNDMSGNNNVGSMVNMSTTTSSTAGKIGQALSFNGVNNYVNIPSTFVLTGNYSLCAWISKDASDVARRVFAVGDTANNIFSFIAVDPAGAPGFHAVQRDGGSLWMIASNNAWHHVCATYAGASVTNLYVDTVAATTTTSAGFWGVDAASGAKIGTRPSLATFFKGYVDDVRFYGRSLSAQEVRMLYGSGRVTTAHAGVSKTIVAHSNPIISSGLVGWWTFDGKDTNWVTGLTNDMSGNANIGQLTSMSITTTPVAGKVGQALSFNGTNNYVDLPGASAFNFAYNQDFSVALWFKAPSVQNNTTVASNIILEKWAGSGGYPFAIRILNQTYGTVANRGKIWVMRYDGTNNPIITSTTALNDNVWHNLGFSKSGSTLSLYIDGILNATTTDTTTGITTNAAHLYIGSEAGNYNFSGFIDETRIYNRALSPAELTLLYNTTR